MLWVEHVFFGITLAWFLKKRDTYRDIILGSILPDIPMVLFLSDINWDDISSASLTRVRLLYFFPHSFLILPLVPHSLRCYYILHIVCDVVSHTGVWSIQPLFPLFTLAVSGFYDPWRLVTSLSLR